MYVFQTFTINQVHTAAQMNQTEVNARDHQHGASGVLTVPAGGLADGAVNVAAKLASNVVTTAKILDANVTQGKLAKPSVGTPELKLAQGSATTGDAVIAVNQFAFGSPSVTVVQGTNVGIITIGAGTSGRNWQTDCSGICPPCSVTYTWDYITASGNPQLWAICGILGDIDALWESEDAAFADETISPCPVRPCRLAAT